MTRLIILILLWLMLAACQNTPTPTPPPTSGIVTAPPIEDALVTTIPTPVDEAIIIEADAEHLLLTNIYARVNPSVVNIEAAIDQGGINTVQYGSGFIYDRNGHIVTNAHLVNQADDIRVTFYDGYVIDAELVAQDDYSDIAVLYVNAPIPRLQPVTLGDSDTVQVGDRAIVIGNPWGLNGSMTTGIISGIGRQLNSVELLNSSLIPSFQNPHIIQIDASLPPGNSGAPLLNSQGQTIGITTALTADDNTLLGVGFGIPSNTIQRVVPALITRGEVDYSWLGINTVRSNSGVIAFSEALGLPVNSGVLITGITPDSPAEAAGLRGGTAIQVVRDVPICAGGDIILAINDYYVQNMDDLTYYLVVNTRPGDVVTLRVVRDGQPFDVPVTLASRPTSGALIPACGEE